MISAKNCLVVSSVAISLVFLFLFTGTGAVNKFLGLFGIDGPTWFSDSRGLGHLLGDGIGLWSLDAPPDLLTDHAVFGMSWWEWLKGPSVAMSAIMLQVIWTTAGTFMLMFLAALLSRPGVTERCELRSRIGVMAYHGGALEQATDVIAAITADQELTAEGRWSHGAASRPLTSAELDALRARLTSATLKAGRDRTWDPPTSEWGAILHTADGGRVGLDFWNETDAEMGWYSLALPSGQISTSERALVLEASQVAGWLRETLEASRVTADGEERPTPPAVAWIAPQAAAEKVPYQLWWARQAGGVG